MRESILITVLSSFLLVSSGASADPPAAISPDQPTAKAETRFQSFCASWMKKLRTRERENLAGAQVERRGDRFVIEYTGYSPEALRCESLAAHASGSVTIPMRFAPALRRIDSAFATVP